MASVSPKMHVPANKALFTLLFACLHLPPLSPFLYQRRSALSIVTAKHQTLILPERGLVSCSIVPFDVFAEFDESIKLNIDVEVLSIDPVTGTLAVDINPWLQHSDDDFNNIIYNITNNLNCTHRELELLMDV